MKINVENKLKTSTVDIYKCAKYSSKKIFSTSLFSFLTYYQSQNKYKIEYVRKLNKKDEKEAKEWKAENLICCTVSATFNPIRRILCVKEKTGLIAIDIDKDKNIGLDVDKAKKDIINLPYVMLTELSCRGEGIWCLIPYDINNDITEVFNALKEDFKELGYVIDDCGDITRLRVISYDDNILIKKECEVYNKFKKFEEVVKNSDTYKEEVDRYVSNDEWILNKQDLKELTIIIYVLVHYHNYHKDDYNEWLLDGFRLATIPNEALGLKLFNMISENSDNYKGLEDVEKKFGECRRTSTYKTNILGYYFNKIKDIYGESWKYRVNDLLKDKGIKI